MSDDAVRVPGLANRTARRWLVGTAVVTVAVVVYLAVTQPENRWAAYTLVPAVLLAIAVLASQRAWIDPVAGTVARARWLTARRTVALSAATTVRLVGSGPQALLDVRSASRGVYLKLLVVSDYVEASQEPAFLTLVAEVLERHVPAKVRGAVPGELRAQAKHLAGGGTPKTSPLARLTSNAMTRGVGGIGAGGGGLSQLP
ncbi:hypothetical protein [Cellulomonas sp. KRMCY2]|uniref:hypothetical protein n=1 Tax=Cellulomonas sp. KRMCY2 TaxID=1304865 RepID=UPI00045EA8E4|nr:hypothetical protein [Cellulomonas sp. KRMCY2]